MNKDELQSALLRIAHEKSKPFCYSCYKVAPTGRCALCGSDDLMRIVDGVGCEYGYDWVIKDILSDLESLDVSEKFEDHMREVYPEDTQIGWLKYDTVSAIKELDPISWDMAKTEWLDLEAEEERLVTFDDGNTYFDPIELESQISKMQSPDGLFESM